MVNSVADPTVERGNFGPASALHARGVRLLGEVVPEKDPYFVHADPAAVCVDVEVRGHCLAGTFDVKLLNPH